MLRFAGMNEEEPIQPDSFQSYVLNDATKSKWYQVVFLIKKQFGKKPDMNGILFLIGVQELGQMREFAKHEKMDLMHLATCKLLSYEGYYQYSHTDADSWPHYTLVSKPPYADLLSQENRLRSLVVRYFEELGLLNQNQEDLP